MQMARRAKSIIRAALQGYGTDAVKRALWNHEFSGGRWACLERTTGDFVYRYVEASANGGSILDLGCGSGNTGTELLASSYSRYVGVDISDVAVAKAHARSVADGRAASNTYVRSDIVTYVPDRQYDVILFRDSIYYVRPRRHVSPTLERYAGYLTSSGVLIVRMYDVSGKYAAIVETIESRFHVVARDVTASRAMVLVFRGR